MVDESTITISGEDEELEEALDESESLFEQFGEKVEEIVDGAREAWDQAWEGAKNAFGAAVDWASNKLSELFDDIKARLDKGVRDFVAQEQSIVQMGAAIRLTGNAAGFTAEQLQKMNDDLAMTSSYTGDAIRGAQSALLGFKNVKGDVFKDALKASMDLAVSMGGDLPGAAAKLGESLNDPIRGLQILKDAGYRFSKDQIQVIEALAKTNDIVGLQRFILQRWSEGIGGEAARMANTFGGQMQRLDNILDQVFKTIGEFLVPSMTKYLIPAAEAAAKVISYVASKFKESGSAIDDFIQRGIKVAIEWFFKFVDAAVTAFTYVQTAVQEFGDFFEMTWKTAQAAALRALALVTDYVVKWAQAAVDAATPVLEFFVDLFKHVAKIGEWGVNTLVSLWKSFADYFKNVLGNMFDNFSNFWEGIKELMSGNTWKFAWKNMEDSFKASISKFPDFVRDTKIGKIDIDKDGKFKEFTDGLRKSAGSAEEDADAAFQNFNARFADNLAKNKDKVAAFIQTMKDIVSGKEITGNPDGEFELPEREKNASESGRGGGMEDLVALNKRIQSAAIKTPETKELEKQTLLMQAHQLQLLNQGNTLIAAVKGSGQQKQPTQPATYGA